VTIAEVISTGTELMQGRGADANFVFLSRYLTDRGLNVRYHATYGDRADDLERGLKLARARADLIVMTGGLGPTDDDLTRSTAAEVFHRPLVWRPRLWARIRRKLSRRAPINRRQAFLPRGARVVPNPTGTAPGFVIRDDTCTFVALSGVPDEMRAMLRRVRLPARPVRLQTFRIFGLPESVVEQKIAGRLGPHGITASRGLITVSVRGGEARRFMRRAFGARIVTEDERDLERVVGERLIEAGRTLAVAESCTGGLLTDRLTDVPGISKVLLESVVAYSNAAKVARLGVRPETLRRHGAVSRPTAVEMAHGVAVTSGAALGLSTTGVCGPTGRPIGLAWVGLWDGARAHTCRLTLRGDRRRIKSMIAYHALDLLRRALG
jgi:nicotinamide-nucleotide amidase